MFRRLVSGLEQFFLQNEVFVEVAFVFSPSLSLPECNDKLRALQAVTPLLRTQLNASRTELCVLPLGSGGLAAPAAECADSCVAATNRNSLGRRRGVTRTEAHEAMVRHLSAPFERDLDNSASRCLAIAEWRFIECVAVPVSSVGSSGSSCGGDVEGEESWLLMKASHAFLDGRYVGKLADYFNGMGEGLQSVDEMADFTKWLQPLTSFDKVPSSSHTQEIPYKPLPLRGPASGEPGVVSGRFPLPSALHQSCKSQGLTIHAAIQASVAFSVTQQYHFPHPVRISNVVDLRPWMTIPSTQSNSVLLSVSGVDTVADCRGEMNPENLLTLARSVHIQLSQSLSRGEHILPYLHESRGDDGAMSSIITSDDQGPNKGLIEISNMGVLLRNTNHTNNPVKSLWIMNTGKGLGHVLDFLFHTESTTEGTEFLSYSVCFDKGCWDIEAVKAIAEKLTTALPLCARW
ncbi:hypothetical protein Pelo_7688 [Pelomyxa schiedti]|nr:hypothetical protein Pelo_7688 [Pelomyxa schiedti]